MKKCWLVGFILGNINSYGSFNVEFCLQHTHTHAHVYKWFINELFVCNVIFKRARAEFFWHRVKWFQVLLSNISHSIQRVFLSDYMITKVLRAQVEHNHSVWTFLHTLLPLTLQLINCSNYFLNFSIVMIETIQSEPKSHIGLGFNSFQSYRVSHGVFQRN